MCIFSINIHTLSRVKKHHKWRHNRAITDNQICVLIGPMFDANQQTQLIAGNRWRLCESLLELSIMGS